MSKTDDTPNVLPLELGNKTMARLLRLAAACGDSPEKIAASLLHDILADDEAVNVMQPVEVSNARH